MQLLELLKLTKEEVIKEAKNHHQLMLKKYPEQIQKCIQNTQICVRDNIPIYKRLGKTKFTLVPLDTISALYNIPYNNDRTLVMNFASFTKPGGRFLDGSTAQEEAIIHESILYEILVEKTEYYEENKFYKNRGLYSDRALYTPNVLFEHNDIIRFTNVLTIAAPNRNILRYNPKIFSEHENIQALTNRIEFIRDICHQYNIKYLIAGAFGCGVFKQRAADVAKIFINTFTFSSCDEVIFAIPPGNNYNHFKDRILEFTNAVLSAHSKMSYISVQV